MTVNTDTSTASYTGNGSTPSFPVPFYFLVDTDISVRHKTAAGVTSAWVLNSEYTLTGAGVQAGGTILPTVVLPTGDVIYISRNVAAVQQTAYPVNSPFPAASHERALDRLTMLIQQCLSKLTFGLFRDPLGNTYDLGANTLINSGTAVNATDVPNLVQTQALVTGAASGILPGLIVTLPQLAANTGATLSGYIAGGASAVSRTVSASLQDFASGKANGAVGDNVNDDTTELASLPGNYAGRKIRLPAGRYAVNAASGAAAITFDYSTSTATPPNDANGATLTGEGERGTVIVPNTAGMYAVKIVGGPTGFQPFVYGTWGDFSIGSSSRTVGANGMLLSSTAFMRVQNMTFTGLNIGLETQSNLSSSFGNLKFYGNNYGVKAWTNTGFSGSNANLWTKCAFNFCNQLAYQGPERHCQVTFDACDFQANGTQGNSTTGAIALVFDGAAGGVGTNFRGCYFENNAGGFDVSLFNSGSTYVTHTFIGCNFNRLSSTNYVTNNIKATGKNIILLIGCTFSTFGNYVESASRLYVNGDSSTIVVCIGCVFNSTVAQGSLRNIDQNVPFVGSVTSAGVAVALPAGWTSSKTSTGVYSITHNLGLATGYIVTGATNDGSVTLVQRVSNHANTFDLVTTNASGTATDGGFGFSLTKI